MTATLTTLHSTEMSPFAQAIVDQKYAHTKPDGTLETWPEIAYRVASNVLGAVDALPGMVNAVAKLIEDRKFMPGGRYLYASGRSVKQTQNCALFRAEDSREGWSDLLHKSSMALMTGAGIGVVYSDVRPKGSIIHRTGGTATGPIALMQMVNEVGRGIMQGGARRCLPEEAFVHTEAGLVPIKHVKVGQLVLTSIGYKKVTGKLDQGVQKLLTITTQNGILECTPNHRIAVVEDVYGGYRWVEAQDLQESDRLCFVNIPIVGTTTELPSHEYYKTKYASTLRDITIPPLDSGIAWLIGLLHGDGYVYLKNDNAPGKRHGKIGIACDNAYPKIIEKAVTQLQRFGIPAKRVEGDGDCTVVTCYSVQLATYLQKHIKTPNTSIQIPDCILQGTQEVRAAYLAGVMDADGCAKTRPVLIAAQIYPEFLLQLQNLCSSLGIATRLKLARPERGNWKPLFHLGVCGGKNLGKLKDTLGVHGHKADFPVPEGIQQFSYSLPGTITNLSGKFKSRSVGINISIEALERELGPLPYTPIAIRNIEEGRLAHTWDIEVEDSQEFITNGYLVHNSAIWAGLHWNHADVMEFVDLKNWRQEVRDLKLVDYNFPAPMDGTNISVILDDAFFAAYRDVDNPQHIHAVNVYTRVVRSMLKTAEPGFAIDCGENEGENLKNACTEITSRDDSDICNLGSVNLARIDSLEEMAEVVQLGTAFLLAGTVYSDVPTEKIRQVRTKNRRLGLGLMGLHEWLLQRGKSYGPDGELAEYLETYRNGSTAAATHYSRKWNLSTPIKTRAIAPTGTIGIAAETTTGIEPIFCVALQRNYLIGDKLHWQYIVDPTAKRLIDGGADPNSIEDAYTLAEDVERRVAFQAWVQEYVDHAISSTINLPAWGTVHNNPETVDQFASMLMRYLPRLRGVTCYPDGARGGQPLTRVDYDFAVANVGNVFAQQMDVCDITKAGSCG